MVEPLEERQLLSVVTVNTNSDLRDGNTASIASLLAAPGADNAISLREAITAANNTRNVGSPDEIRFDIPGSGVHTIQPLSPLPSITDPVVIDGYSQPGARRNDLPTGSNAILLVELSGSAAGSGTHGLVITGGQSTVQGLVINRFGGDGIRLATNGNNVIAGNYIGTNAAGSAKLANQSNGVAIYSGAQNVVGIDGDGVGDFGGRNVIAGNTAHGVRIGGAGANQNVVAGNYIGLDATGSVALGNNAQGVYIDPSAQNNRIGTNADGNADEAERNVISANGRAGVRMDGDFNLVAGNYIGTDVSGSLDRGNAAQGVYLYAGAQSNQIGGSSALGNRIAFNRQVGVAVVDAISVGNRIRANRIYCNAQLGIDLGNNGVTANDTGDADTGPNNNQNYPQISAAYSGATTRVVGSLNSTANTAFTMDFYANSAMDPSGFGEGQRWLGSVDATTDMGGNVVFDVVFPAPTSPGARITATATDPAGNTSEFSGAETVIPAPLPVMVPGPPGGPEYFGIREVINNGAITNQTDATNSLLSGTGTILDYTAPTLNIQDSGSRGHAQNDSRFAAVDQGYVAYGNADNLSLVANGTISIPTEGDYTFLVNSDDGFRLAIDGRYIGAFEGGRPPGDSFMPAHLTAGTHALQLTYHESGGGAEVELLAAPGVKTAYDNTFRLVGDTTPATGPAGIPAGEMLGPWHVKEVAYRSYQWLNNIDEATALLDVNDPGVAVIVEHLASVINFKDPEQPGTEGQFGSASRAPFGIDDQTPYAVYYADGKDQAFAIRATNTLRITTEGDYSFGIHSDDGFSFRIAGATFDSVVGGGALNASRDTMLYWGGTADSDTIGRVHLAAGDYLVQLDYFNWFFGACVELSGTTGFKNSWDQTFTLLGDTRGLSLVEAAAVVPTGNVLLNSLEGHIFADTTVAAFSDPTGPDPFGSYSATIDWGDGTASAAKIIVPAYESNARKADVLFLMDSTGSMGACISGMKTAFRGIVSAVESRLPGIDIQYAVADYKDYLDGGNYTSYGVNLRQAFTSNISYVQSAINSLSASGGYDTPESQLKAMASIAANWLTPTGPLGFGGRADSQRVIVWAGDAYGHVLGDTAGDGPASYYPTLLETVTALNATGIEVVGLSPFGQGSGIDEYYGGANQEQYVTSNTRGTALFGVVSRGPTVENAVVDSIVGEIESTFLVQGSHTYPDDGRYPISSTARVSL